MSKFRVVNDVLQIEINQSYSTRGGLIAVIEDKKPSDYPYIYTGKVVYPNGYVETGVLWNGLGFWINKSTECALDLIEKSEPEFPKGA